MKTLKDADEHYVLELFFTLPLSATLGEIYAYTTQTLHDAGFQGVTEHKVRRLCKKLLKRYGFIPQRPTLSDYQKARAKQRQRGDSLR